MWQFGQGIVAGLRCGMRLIRQLQWNTEKSNATDIT